MKASKALLNTINAVMASYSGWKYPREMQGMYDALNAIGVSTGMVTNRQDNARGSWRGTAALYLHGNEIENAIMIYGVYEGGNTDRNEYNIYAA